MLKKSLSNSTLSLIEEMIFRFEASVWLICRRPDNSGKSLIAILKFDISAQSMLFFCLREISLAEKETVGITESLKTGF